MLIKRCIAFGSILFALTAGPIANAAVPCSASTCHSTLHATQKVRHWKVKGSVGEGWLLYLNVYVNGKRLEYKRLPGGCEASYVGQNVSVLLHACGHRSKLDYVSFNGSKDLRVKYRYRPR